MANIAQVHLLGPTQDTNSTTTVTYTLGGGETVTAGNGVAVYVSAAGSTSCLIASVADSKGNTWVVPTPSGIAPSGSVAATVAYCTKVATALAAGDTITATLSHASTDKQILVEEYTNQDQSDMLDAAVYVGGLGGAGSTAPTVSTGSTATGVAHELLRCLLTWNGSSALTLDAQLTSLYSGHFDNAGASQTKQQSLSGKTLSVTGTQSVTDTLAANQPWAILMTCWKSTTAPATSTAKNAARGLSTRDGEKPPTGYGAAFSNRMIDVAWGPPTGLPGGTTQTNPMQASAGAALDATELARLDALIDAAVAAGDTVTFRLFAGQHSPDWLKSQVGTFSYADTAGTTPSKVVQVPKFWLQGFWDAWNDFMAKLAAHFDGGSSPTTRQAAMRGVQICMGMTYYAEPFQRHTNSSQNRAEMVGGGLGWAGRSIAAPGAGFSFAADMATQKKCIDIHAANWPNTPAHIAFTPWQVLLSQTEAGFAYSGDNQKYWGSDQPGIPNTKSIIDYAVAVLGVNNLLVIENNSVRSSYFNSTATALSSTTSAYGQMYVYFNAKPYPKYFQMGNASQVGNFDLAMKGAVGVLLANAAEPTHNSGTSPYDATNLGSWNTKLLAVALPGGGQTAHIPVNTALPTIDVPTAGYTPTTVLTAHGGTFNPGTHAITKHTFQWYRLNPSTNAVTSVRGPTDDSSSPYSDTYTIQNADLGFLIYVTDIATNSDGPSLVAQSLSTPAVTTPATPAPTNTTLPSITPIAPVARDTLVADHGVWTGTPTTYTYSWSRSTDGGANYSLVQVGGRGSYATQPTDVGALFEVSVVANNGQDSSPAVSAPTAAVVTAPVLTIDTPTDGTIVIGPAGTQITVSGTVSNAGGASPFNTWIMTKGVLAQIDALDSTTARATFDTATTYTIGDARQTGYVANTPMRSYKDFYQFYLDLTNTNYPGYAGPVLTRNPIAATVGAVLYDNENWGDNPPSTPDDQQRDPLTFMARFRAAAAQAPSYIGRSLKIVAAPARTLYLAQTRPGLLTPLCYIGSSGTGGETLTQAWERCNPAGAATGYDVFSIQSQAEQANAANYLTMVTDGRIAALTAQPAIKTLAGLSTGLAQGEMTGAQLYAAAAPVGGLVSGFWLNALADATHAQYLLDFVALLTVVAQATLTVDGAATPFNVGTGAFSTTVTLATGADTITVTATDAGGNATTTAVTVTLTQVPIQTIVISADVQDIELKIHQRGLQ